MSDNADDVVKVADGDMVAMELYRQALADAGIQAQVVGEALGAGMGTAIPGSVELWVRGADAEKAQEVISNWDEEQAQPRREPAHYPHPQSDPKPKGHGGQGPHGHYQKEPGTS
ncbi:MAG TPA: DUF2007 domain-containing protein [Gemmataceae bacterium]|nr:DUF2007 domain-containing protein [Gemmataceae bacterium]